MSGSVSHSRFGYFDGELGSVLVHEDEPHVVHVHEHLPDRWTAPGRPDVEAARRDRAQQVHQDGVVAVPGIEQVREKPRVRRSCHHFLFPAVGHLEPVELFLDLVEGVVTDLVAAAHREDGVAGRLQRLAVQRGVLRADFRGAVDRLLFAREVRRELTAHRVGEGRAASFERGQAGLQGALARGAAFAADGIVVLQLEHPQEGPQRQTLNDQGAQHDRERRRDDQVTVGERRRQRQRRGERHDTAHAGPGDDQAAAHGGTKHQPRRLEAEGAVAPAHRPR